MEDKLVELEHNSVDPDGGAALTEGIRSLFLKRWLDLILVKLFTYFINSITVVCVCICICV